MPANGSVGTVTLSFRYIAQVRAVLERERFDVLHFHEPFVPFLSLVILRGVAERQHRHVPRLRRLVACVRVRQPRHGRLRRPAARADRGVGAAARHFIDRYFPGDYKVIPNGVDIDRYRRAVPVARWQDGTANILFVGRFEPRKGVLDLLQAYRGSCAETGGATGRLAARSAAGRAGARRPGATSPPAEQDVGRPVLPAGHRDRAAGSGRCRRRWGSPCSRPGSSGR